MNNHPLTVFCFLQKTEQTPRVPKNIVITPEEIEKKRAKEVDAMHQRLKEGMEKLKRINDKITIKQASKNKTYKSKGNNRKHREKNKETSSKETQPAKKVVETILTDKELDALTEIEWPEEFQRIEEDTEVVYDITGHRIDENGVPQFFLQFTWEDDKADNGWYPATNALTDYPHITATFMMQMKLNKNKDWEKLWKKVEKKLRNNQPRQERVEEGNLQCEYDHEKIGTNFEGETNPAYWGPNGDMHGGKCNRCEKDIAKDCKPSSNKPVFCCKGRTKYFCKTCMCNACYVALLLKDADGPEARKRHKKAQPRTSS